MATMRPVARTGREQSRRSQSGTQRARGVHGEGTDGPRVENLNENSSQVHHMPPNVGYVIWHANQDERGDEENEGEQECLPLAG